MKALPTKVTHISTGATFKPLSMDLGGTIKMKCISKGNMLTKKGTIHTIDLDEIYVAHLYVTPIGENFI